MLPRASRVRPRLCRRSRRPLRPEEAVELRPENLASLPDHGWGELILTGSEPRSGTWWTDSGTARQRRASAMGTAGISASEVDSDSPGCGLPG